MFRSKVALSLTVLFALTLANASSSQDVPRKILLIGDSTVKNGQGDGAGALWGWGSVLHEFVDTAHLEIVNRARGGRSSRTYLTEGLWEAALSELNAGDVLLIQFGHNDGGEMFAGDRPRASIKGNGEETKDGIVESTGKSETVHSYGWYLRKFVSDAENKGAKCIVFSPIPRNRWSEGRVLRASEDYAKWAREAAEMSGAKFIDLNELAALGFEELGESKVRAEFFTSTDHTHTTQVGARFMAKIVASNLSVIPELGVASK